MNWDAISTIAEVVGAAAVVGTLIYLAIQIRQGNDYDRVQGIQQLGRDYATHTAVVTGDGMIGSFMKGLTRYGELSPAERAKFEYCVGGYINLGEAALVSDSARRTSMRSRDHVSCTALSGCCRKRRADGVPGR